MYAVELNRVVVRLNYRLSFAVDQISRNSEPNHCQQLAMQVLLLHLAMQSYRVDWRMLIVVVATSLVPVAGLLVVQMVAIALVPLVELTVKHT
jgi:hypothetical protein